jgi:bla regulator protein blaR1
MLPLARRAAQSAILTFALAVAHCAVAQADAAAPPSVAAPAFDVVSIRPVPSGALVSMIGLHYTDDGFDSQSVTLSMLIRAAYGSIAKFPTDDRVTGLPDWAKTTSYQIGAKMTEADTIAFKALPPDEKDKHRQAMLQAMLADRFQLTAHLGAKPASVYELVIAKTGAKLKETEINPDSPRDRDGKPITGGFLMMKRAGSVTAQAFTTSALANFLSQPMAGLGRTVVDKTGLTGKYSFTLNWSPDPGLSGGGVPGLAVTLPPPSDETTGASIFTALQEQLGLRLQPATDDLPIIIVDHIEHPSDN